MEISQDAIELIVAEEIGDEEYYNAKCRGFEWPAGASGPTVGVGYDCGYYSKEQIHRDWSPYVDERAVGYLVAASGKKGFNAKSFVGQYRRFIDIPLETAMKQFTEVTLPTWIERTIKAVPGAEDLPPDCLGALVSLTFNRGDDYSDSDRRREMHLVKVCVELGDRESLAEVPKLFRQMKRHWPPGHPNHNALTRRREHEAVLFEKGLTSLGVGSEAMAPSEDRA